MHDAQSNLLFPTLSARNLAGCTFLLPAGLGGERNVLVLIFQSAQHALAAGWFPFLERLLARQCGLQVYEIALVPSVYTLARPFIDGGMIAGTPDRAIRERTLTSYTDVAQITQALGITAASIAVLLVDRAGQVLWCGQGAYHPAQAAMLERLADQW